jgi:peptidoglycan-N-acetylglucosamine deacetylase
VATPLQPNARPAQTIVSSATECPSARSRYGRRLETARPTSTIVIVRRSPGWLTLRAGANSPAPTTPITIASIARCSVRPACSPSMRSPRSSSTSSPAASAGCTTTSGASSSATTCSGQPRIDRPVPSIQRARLSNPQTSATRRCSSRGASLASIACRAIPRLYRVDAPTAAAIPSTRSTMSATDHRTRRSLLAGALGAAGATAYALPALASARPARFRGSPAAISPRLRALLGVEDTTSSGHGYALTFDDGPHPEGTPAVLEILARERVRATFFLVGEQVLRDPALARETADAGHAIALHCHRHRNLLRLAPSQVREDIARAEDAIVTHTGCAPTLYRPPYGVLNAAALRLARARGWRTLMWSHWGRDWEASATSDLIAARVTDGAGEGAVLLLHDADDYSAPGSWRRTAQALPRVLATLAERGLEPQLP